MRLPQILSLSLFVALLLGVSTAQAASFGCSATAARITVLGQKVDPVKANANGTECAGDVKTLGGENVGLPLPLSAGALVAATEVYSAEKAVLASGGIADLKLRALPTLPITLPTVSVPDQLKSVSVDLTPVKSALKTALDPLNLGLVDATLALVNDQITVDASAAVNALLPDGKLPTVDLLQIRGVMAYAAGSCQTGAPGVSSSSSVAGIRVLGVELPINELVERTVKLIDTAAIDPSQANLAAVNLNLPGAFSTILGTVPAAQAALATALQNALDALPNLKVLDPTLAQVKVTPGLEARSSDSVTRQALNVSVTIAGQPLLEAVIGEAKVSAAGVECAEPVLDPSTPTGAALGCGGKRLVLVDVLERKDHVKLHGVADPSLAGEKVAIVFNATGRTVAHAKVDRDGTFDTIAPLPPKSLRDSNEARYMATLGKERSINLKLRRRMIVTSMTSANGKVTIAGRVVRPLATPVRAITVKRRVTCFKEQTVTRFKPRSNGRFRVTFKAPKGVGSAVYRMTTKVRFSATGTGLFETYTLPRAVDLD